MTDPSVLHERWLIKLCRQLAFVPSREAVFVETLVSLLFHLLLLESLVFISQGCNGSRVRNPVTRSLNPSMTGGETKLSASTERSWARNEVTHIYRSTGRVRRRGLICMMIPTREIKLSPPFLESKDSVWVVLQVKWARLY